jgi:hypothetical protein
MPSLREAIFECRNGIDLDKLLKKLQKQATPAERRGVLMDYAIRGRILHWRSFVIPDIIELTAPDEAAMFDFFAARLKSPRTAYWAIEGLVKAGGRRAYPIVAESSSNARV